MVGRINKQVLAAGSVGNILEWYDFAIYGYLAPILAAQFFPTGDPVTSLIAAFGVFAAGYFMRPIGALWIGHIGDRVGRKAALTLSIALMAIPTGLITFLPTYAAIGIAAPALLTGLRLLQGISVGGEYTGSGVFLVERAGQQRRGLIGSLATASGIGGILLASAVAALMTNLMSADAFADWGWRLAFIPGPIIGVLGYFLRRQIAESQQPVSDDAPAQVPIPIVEAMRNHGGALVRVGAIAAAYGVTFYMAFVFLTTYLTTVVKSPRAEVLDMNTAAMALLIFLVPLSGWLSDRVGRVPVMLFGAVGTVLLAYPLFVMLHSGDLMLEWIGDIIFAVLVAAFAGPNTAMMCESFPLRVRYTGVSIAYNLPSGVLGGSTPLVATWLIEATGNDFSPAFYLAAVAAIGVVAVIMIGETKDRVMD